MATRQQVYQAIDLERDYQDDKFAPVGGISASPEGFLLVIEELSNEVRTKITKGQLAPLGDSSVALDYMRKIGATCVRALEQHGIVYR